MHSAFRSLGHASVLFLTWLLLEEVQGNPSVERLLSEVEKVWQGDIPEDGEFQHLQEDDGDNEGVMGARCGGNRPPCQSPFECSNFGFPLGNRCSPNSCLKQEMETLDPNTVEQWQQSIFARAGVVQADFLDEMEQEREQSRLPFLDTIRKSASFRSNKDAVLQAAEENTEFTGTMEAILRKCSNADVIDADPRTTEQALFYLGCHYEAGLGVDASYSDIGGSLDMECCPFGRFCLGGAYLGAQIGTNLGVFLPGRKDTANITSVYFMAELDAAAGIGGSLSFGIGLNGYSFLELGVAGGAGAGAGLSVCYTFPGGLEF